jgi:hypothetical protein
VRRAGHGNAQGPVGHLHEAVVVLEQAATAAEHEVAPGGGTGECLQTTQPARHGFGTEVAPAALRLIGHDRDRHARAGTAQHGATRLEDGMIAEIAVGITGQDQDAGLAHSRSRCLIRTPHALSGKAGQRHGLERSGTALAIWT